MKKIGKFNLLEKNVCTLHCHCGWNLHFGGKNVADLYRIEKFLKEGTMKKELDIKYELEKIWIMLSKHEEILEKLRAEKKGEHSKG